MASNNLKKLRRELDLSQPAFAARAEVPLPTIRYLEQGGSTPRLDTAARIAKALGCPVLRVFPEIPIAGPGQGKAVFEATYREIIDALDDVSRLRFWLWGQLTNDVSFRAIMSPFGPKTYAWPDIIKRMHVDLGTFAAQARLDELIAELEKLQEKSRAKAAGKK